MIGLCGKRGALRRRRCIPGEAKLGRENSGGVGWVTNGVEVVGGGARRRGGGPTARTWRAMAGRLVAAVVVRDGLLGWWWSVEGGAGSRGGRGCHKARGGIDDAVRGGGGHGRADEDVGGALASGKQVNADDGEAIAESSNDN